MGAGDFHGRVRDGIGCGLPAIATRLSNPPILAPCGRWEGCGSGAVLGVCLPRVCRGACPRAYPEEPALGFIPRVC